jgi:hypothetical protein
VNIHQEPIAYTQAPVQIRSIQWDEGRALQLSEKEELRQEEEPQEVRPTTCLLRRHCFLTCAMEIRVTMFPHLLRTT